MKTVLKLVLASLLFGGSVANAALVNFSLEGTVDLADSGNVFGLSSGNTVFASGTFDDSVLPGTGEVTIALDAVGNSLLLEIGTQTFTEMDDSYYGTGFPNLVFTDGIFTSLNFIGQVEAFGFFDSNLGFFEGEDDAFNLITGYWNTSSFTVTPVPVPAAVWLFGSGLLGLVGVARRKTA